MVFSKPRLPTPGEFLFFSESQMDFDAIDYYFDDVTSFHAGKEKKKDTCLNRFHWKFS